MLCKPLATAGFGACFATEDAAIEPRLTEETKWRREKKAEENAMERRPVNS
jgi:hypothetical protein